ncbi:MAG: putative acyltransferase [Firmicutes bacterium]|nr:putative acyltransferase [Bacillota bacterium]
MLNINYGIPVLIAANFNDTQYSSKLIKSIKKFLPEKFYTHIDKEVLEDVFADDELFNIEEYMNMGLCDNCKIGEK